MSGFSFSASRQSAKARGTLNSVASFSAIAAFGLESATSSTRASPARVGRWLDCDQAPADRTAARTRVEAVICRYPRSVRR